ncbi:uncharacterized protein [Lepeophtheirus salmonis]|uniref:uncharacterized protein n=1 Tax=Lepeophtheirus salmonis TaxID=72036 RepID=UPI001AE5F370|nr:uncharacterized protein LOC121116282 [Lepeophtheirus salmonis]
MLFLLSLVILLRTSYSESKIPCKTDLDCPKYGYCHVLPPLVSHCIPTVLSNLKCVSVAPNGVIFANHTICLELGKTLKPDSNELYMTERCILVETPRGRNYTCGLSYYNPCPDTFDNSGTLLKTEDCPNHFNCDEVQFKDGYLRVCRPDLMELDGLDVNCKNNFDCGYSNIYLAWRTCDRGKCVLDLEKKFRRHKEL